MDRIGTFRWLQLVYVLLCYIKYFKIVFFKKKIYFYKVQNIKKLYLMFIK